MKHLTTQRLCWLVIVACLISWSLHFFHRIERPSIGWFEAVFGGWAMLPLATLLATSTVIRQIRGGRAADAPAEFYARGASRYLLLALVVSVSAGLVALGIIRA